MAAHDVSGSPRYVIIDGMRPGSGKSTLAAGLAAVLRGAGEAVELVAEDVVFGRSDLAGAGRELPTAAPV